MKRLWVAALSAILAHTPAQAEVDEVVRKALAMTESGRARQACEMLEPLEVQRAGDPGFRHRVRQTT